MKTIATVMFAICSFLAFPGSAQSQPKAGAEQKPVVEYLNRGGGQGFPFSEAVRVGDWLILSGRIGTDNSGKLVAGGIEAETRQTLDSIGAVLKANGASFDDVVKCTVMLADMKEWPAMNAIYRTYFKPNRMPARSALGVNGLALGARVEIECWAVKSRG